MSDLSVLAPASLVKLIPIPHTNGRYSAGDDGHIYCYSSARVNAKRPCPFRLCETPGSEGYPHVSVLLNGKRKTKSVHVLVCLAFHGDKPSPIHEVRHLDGSRANCTPENLAWGTPSENEADKRRHGTAAIGERQGIAKLTDEAVRIIRASIPRGLWNTADAAKVFGVKESTIRQIASGRGWSHVIQPEVSHAH